MGAIRRVIAVTGWSALGTAVGFTVFTRKSKMYQVSDTDYLLGTTIFARYNPYNNPAMRDVCVREVPMSQIKTELLQHEEKLVEKFCAGVFGGWAYEFQRRYLERKYRNSETEKQLWESKDIQESSFPVGTLITDHFEVISKTHNSIIVRCGDSPRVNAIRESDGLFEMIAEVNKEEGKVEFGLKSIFFNSAAEPRPSEHGVPAHIEWAHRKYTKALMEDAVRNCMA